MAQQEREVLERAVHAVAEQAAKTNSVIDEAMDAKLAADHPVTIAAKKVRLELLKVKADLERELSKLVLNCIACGIEVHRVSGVSMADPGHWGATASPPRTASWRSKSRYRRGSVCRSISADSGEPGA